MSPHHFPGSRRPSPAPSWPRWVSVPCPIPHGRDGMDVPVHPDAEVFPGPFPGLGECCQPFLRLVVTTVHFPKGHMSPPNRGDLQGWGWHPWDDAHPEPPSLEGPRRAPWGDLTAVMARCWWPRQAWGQRAAAARRLAGRCSRRVVQPRWPALGSSPPQLCHHPPVALPAPPVAAAAASALVAGTAWLWPAVVALGMVAGLWPCSSSFWHCH